MPSKEEQETTVTWSPADNFAHIYTSVPKHLKRLRADSRVKETRSYEEAGTFLVPRNLIDPLTGFKRARKEMTPEQREATAARLKVARAGRVKNGDA